MIVPTINRCRWFSMVFPYLPSSMNSYFPFSRHSSSSKNPWFRAGFSGLSGLSSCAFLVAGDFYELPDGANPSLFGRKGSWGGQGQAGMLAKAWLMAVSTSWDSLNVLKPPHLVNMIWNKESTFWEECRDQFTSKNNVHWRIWRVGHDRKTTKKIHDGWSMVGERRSAVDSWCFIPIGAEFPFENAEWQLSSHLHVLHGLQNLNASIPRYPKSAIFDPFLWLFLLFLMLDPYFCRQEGNWRSNGHICCLEVLLEASRKPWDAMGLSHEFINVYYIMFISL